MVKIGSTIQNPENFFQPQTAAIFNFVLYHIMLQCMNDIHIVWYTEITNLMEFGQVSQK